MNEILKQYHPNELRMMLTGCQKSLLFCAQLFFKRRDMQKFITSLHHIILCHVLDEVYNGNIKRLIINIPPGYTKTELAVIFFVIKGLLINSRAKFMHTSYSGDLALLNSGIIKDMTQDPMFQTLCPMQIKVDTKAKARWYTNQGGGMMAAAQGGQITGFRAGRMDKTQFTGALIIDDPIKPNDAQSKSMRERINDTFNNTIKSRLATEDVPIIIIMQRVHENDLTGYLLSGGSSEQWHHLEIPAHINKHPEPYPHQWAWGIPIPHNLPVGPTWTFKHNYEELKEKKAADQYVWNCQYKQRPTSLKGTMYQRDWFPLYSHYDAVNCWVVLSDGSKVGITRIVSFSDTALKSGEENDFTCFQTWGMGADGRIYLLNRIHDKWDSVDLEKHYIRYLKRLKFVPQSNNLGPDLIGVEDKASGIGLIQSINRKIGTRNHTDDRGNKIDLTGIPKITPIPRGPKANKAARGLSIAPHIKRGEVVLPGNAPWLDMYLDEMCAFNTAMTHAHDDQWDPTADAVHNLLIENTFIDYSDVVNGPGTK